MNVPDFIEMMRRKSELKQKHYLTSVVSQTTNCFNKNDLRTSSECQHTNIVFFMEEKLTTNVKRRYESQVGIYCRCFNSFDCLFDVGSYRFQIRYQKHYRNYHQKYVLR